MMEGAGFEVVDLGINNSVEKYLEAMETEAPDILGMSALLTTTMPYMKVVIDTMVEQGIREDYIVLVGGAPSTRNLAKPSARTLTAATPRLQSKPPKSGWAGNTTAPKLRRVDLNSKASPHRRGLLCWRNE